MISKGGRLKVVGIGGTPRGDSTSLRALRRALEAAEGLNPEIRRTEAVGGAV
jgi:hypothetical protein